VEEKDEEWWSKKAYNQLLATGKQIQGHLGEIRDFTKAKIQQVGEAIETFADTASALLEPIASGAQAVLEPVERFVQPVIHAAQRALESQTAREARLKAESRAQLERWNRPLPKVPLPERMVLDISYDLTLLDENADHLKAVYELMQAAADQIYKVRQREIRYLADAFTARSGPEDQYLDLLLEFGAVFALAAGRLPAFVIDNGLKAARLNPQDIPADRRADVLQNILYRLTTDAWLQARTAHTGPASEYWTVYSKSLFNQDRHDTLRYTLFMDA
jgi:hypothetical protein